MASLLSPPLDDSDHRLGDAAAELELVMFGDFQCPFCLGAQSVIRRVRDRLGERLMFAFRHLPIRSKHPMAEAAAEASEAAAAQGRFWDYHDALYDAQAQLSPELLVVLAERIGLDAGRLEEELREGRWRERVERDVRSAQESGASGTPTFFTNGRLHGGAYDAGSLVEALTG